jgi:hypothetical protein
MARARFVCAILFALALPAEAQEARSWILNEDGDAASLLYGTPDSDDVLINFSCDARERSMRIMAFVGTDKLVPGHRAKLGLRAGTASLELTGDAVAGELDGIVNVMVAGTPNPRLTTLLKAGPTLTVEPEGGSATIPLAGIAAHLPAFEKVCFARR